MIDWHERLMIDWHERARTDRAEIARLRKEMGEVAQELDNFAWAIAHWMERPRLAEHVRGLAGRLREADAEPTASPARVAESPESEPYPATPAPPPP